MKKSILFLAVFLVLIAGGCAKKQEAANMNELSEDKRYHYQNKDLGFALSLPPEFIYFQTQRKEADGIINLEIYVPTSDRKYPQEVPGYGKPVVVNVYPEKQWSSADKSGMNYQEAGKKDGKIYVLNFWKAIPTDWKSKWNDGMKKEIVNKFKII